MKDLLVYVADADAQGFLGAILNKPQAIGVRSISFDIERHPQRDAGMVQSGAELTRMKKGRYHRALLILDHHGSGRDHKQAPHQVATEIQTRLNDFSWKGNSAVTVLVPELEEWIWFCESAVLAYCGVMPEQLQQWLDKHARKLGTTTDDLKKDQPKELFEHVMRDRLRRTISPRDFAEIGSRAGINGLLACDSFRSVTEILRCWFSP